MSLFNLKVPTLENSVSHHPWERVIKDEFACKMKYAHNSIKNPKYPKEKEKKAKPLVVPKETRVKFTIVGNRVTKEFIYCVNVVKGLHKYRRKAFDPPSIRGVTGVEWPLVWNDLKIRYGELAFCLNSQVAVIMNDTFLGGENELKELIESKYVYHLILDYHKEGVNNFAAYVRSSGRPCAYFHFSINDEETGSMIFMLYSDIVPYTCENFLRLCKQTRGGYGGTAVHRIVKDGWIQCGGFGLKNNEDLGCENFIVPHDRRGALCMANDGRNVDCSTQFFILLQPEPWMAYKYVAFGQLIDGENTLKKIEQVPTFYESPTKDIKIIRSGILNMDCQDKTINKRTKEFIFGHIDDLIVIGELFYEALLEKVFAEIERREQQVLMGEELEGEFMGEGDLIKDSKRFIRKKEDIEKQLGKSENVIPDSIAPEHGEAEEFPYDYEYEVSPYQHVSVGAAASMVVKRENPFYLPLTDVPYPDEVDSTYDLKKFLKGDYCHEIDLEIRREPKKTAVSYPSEVFVYSESSDESHSSVELDSEEEREIKKYLSQNVDRVSFAGDTVKKISRGYAKLNLFEGADMSELFTITDELLRRVRTMSPDSHARHAKKVSVNINAEDEEKVHHKIKRRQTGFVRPNELERVRMAAKMHQQQSDEENDDNSGGTQKRNKSLSVKIADDENQVHHKIKRRQTGFVRSDKSESSEYDKENDCEAWSFDRKVSVNRTAAEEKQSKIAMRRSGFVRSEDLEKVVIIDRSDDGLEDRKVRISPKQPSSPAHEKQKQMRRPTGFVRTGPLDGDGSDIEIHRPSVLKRLYDDVAIEDDEDMPTLKDYKTKTELMQKKSNLLTTENLLMIRDESKDKYYRHPSVLSKDISHENVLNLQHGKKIARKISSDYVKTIDQIEKRQQNSIRSIEFAKSRPAISVTDYQTKNSKYQEELRNSFRNQTKKNKPDEHNDSVGLRLPGDTPLFLESSSENLKNTEEDAARRVNEVRSKLSRMMQSKHAH